jgi:hypothetical protein
MKRRDFVKSIPAIAISTTLSQYAIQRQPHLIALGTSASKLIQENLTNLKLYRVTFINDKKPENFQSRNDFIEYKSPDTAYNYYSEHRFLKNEIPSETPLPTLIQQKIDSIQGKIILLTGLGRFTGSFLYPQITRYLYSSNKESHFLCSLPFEFEGEFWRKTALELVGKIQGDQKILDLEELRRTKGNLSIRSAFGEADKWMMEELIRILG